MLKIKTTGQRFSGSPTNHEPYADSELHHSRRRQCAARSRCTQTSCSSQEQAPQCQHMLWSAAERDERAQRALNSTKPPSELASGRSKRATTGFANPSPWKVTCAIQSVAIEAPRLRASKCLNNASIALASGSVALLFHLSRIFRLGCGVSGEPRFPCRRGSPRRTEPEWRWPRTDCARCRSRLADPSALLVASRS